LREIAFLLKILLIDLTLSPLWRPVVSHIGMHNFSKKITLQSQPVPNVLVTLTWASLPALS